MDSEGAQAILDASALLALMYDEAGADRVEAVLRRGAAISTVNWAEAISRMAERGEPTAVSEPRINTTVAAAGSLAVIAFDAPQAVEAARLRVPTRHLGLSLGDRACLGLGRLRRLPVYTTDRAWRSLHISVRIEVIR